MIEDYSKLILGNEIEGYHVPTYDAATYGENLKIYKAWRRLRAEQGFEDAIGSVDKDSVERTKEIILQFPYHPNFSVVFFAYLVNRLPGCSPLQPGEVDAFLEGMYGISLERPDCDHLLSIIRKHGPYPIQAPDNIQRAIRWLKSKQQGLPAWPPLSNADATSEQNWRYGKQAIQADNNKKTLKKRAHTIELAGAETNPIDKLLLPGFSFSSLKELLRELNLIGDTGKATALATPAAVAGVVIALWDSNCLLGNAEGTQKAFIKLFSMVISPGSLQGIHRNTPKKNSRPSIRRKFYDLAVAYLNQLRQSE